MLVLDQQHLTIMVQLRLTLISTLSSTIQQYFNGADIYIVATQAAVAPFAEKQPFQVSHVKIFNHFAKIRKPVFNCVKFVFYSHYLLPFYTR